MTDERDPENDRDTIPPTDSTLFDVMNSLHTLRREHRAAMGEIHSALASLSADVKRMAERQFETANTHGKRLAELERRPPHARRNGSHSGD